MRKVPLGQIDVHEARLAYGDLKVDTKLGPMKKIARTIQSCLTNVVHYCPHSITPAVG
ncbi:hypothetical protein [Bremerella cremea]|uniref:hypothetical protein n=1 Tax=Bremerella cremea TaxID=1031537 RepID=UPI00131462E9|nr:hypothetical protein [Bremerella cremea]